MELRAIRERRPDPRTLQSACKLVIVGAYLSLTATLRDRSSRHLGKCTAFTTLPLYLHHLPSLPKSSRHRCRSRRSAIPPPPPSPSASRLRPRHHPPLPPLSTSPSQPSRRRRRRHPSHLHLSPLVNTPLVNTTLLVAVSNLLLIPARHGLLIALAIGKRLFFYSTASTLPLLSHGNPRFFVSCLPQMSYQ